MISYITEILLINTKRSFLRKTEKKEKKKETLLISSANFRGITIRRCDLLSEARFTGTRRRVARRVSSNFPRDSVASRAPVEKRREKEKRGGEYERRGEPRAIVIKHRELAKLWCNLAGDVLPHGLARRGPRGAPIHTCTQHTYVCVYVCECVRGGIVKS